MLSEIARIVLAVRPDLGSAASAERIRYVNVTGSVEGATSTFLAFQDPVAEPRFVVKVSRVRGVGAFANEDRILRTLAGISPRIAEAVPVPIWCGELNGHAVLAMTFVDGAAPPVPRLSDGRLDLPQARPILDSALGWLREMNHAVRDRSADAVAPAAGRARTIAGEFERLFRPSARDRACVEAALRDVEAIAAHGTLIQHGDFCRHNILLCDGGIKVIDWTSARSGGLPLHDACFFLFTFLLQTRVEPGIDGLVASFVRTFLERDECGAAVEEYLFAHLDALDIPRAHLRPLVVLFLMERAVADWHLVSACVARGAYPRFPVAVAAARGATRDELGAQQFWIEFFRTFARRDVACEA